MTAYKPEITTAARRIARTINTASDWEIVFFDRDGSKIASMHENDARWQTGNLGFDYALALTGKAGGEKMTQAIAQVWIDSLEQENPAAWRNTVFAELEAY